MKRFVLSMVAAVAACATHRDGAGMDPFAGRQDSGRLESRGAARIVGGRRRRLVSHGERSHLFYVGKVGEHEFKNFEFSAEVMTSPGANSGIYVHTKWQGPGWPEAGYELQVINSNPPAETMNGYIEHKMTGSIYAVRNNWKAPVADNEWFNYRIRVVGKTIQTFINDALICEYAEPDDPSVPRTRRDGCSAPAPSRCRRTIRAAS